MPADCVFIWLAEKISDLEDKTMKALIYQGPNLKA